MVITPSPGPVNETNVPLREIARRFCVVTTGKRFNTTSALRAPLAAIGIDLVQMAWNTFVASRELPFGAWAIGDFDRIDTWTIELGAYRHDALQAAGCPVWNDPRRFNHRAGFIRTLYKAGINSFTCWLPALAEVPDRFPCFLRTIYAHRGGIGDGELIHSARDAQALLDHTLRTTAHTLTDLVFIEYRAEPEAGSTYFRRHAATRIGDRILRALTVNDTHWIAKFGVNGVATENTYRQELADFHAFPHEAEVRRVTDLIGVQFGRVDYGIVGGRLEFYEFNTNPTFGFPDDHPSPSRITSGVVNRAALIEAIDALVPAAGVMVDMAGLRYWPRNSP